MTEHTFQFDGKFGKLKKLRQNDEKSVKLSITRVFRFSEMHLRFERFEMNATHTQCGNYRNLLSLLRQKIRESNIFTVKLAKELISRNENKFLFFHTVA